MFGIVTKDSIEKRAEQTEDGSPDLQASHQTDRGRSGKPPQPGRLAAPMEFTKDADGIFDKGVTVYISSLKPLSIVLTLLVYGL
jgi:hypothetical protein